MARKILLVPDIYYRNWEEIANPGSSAKGEMWLCLRPMVEGEVKAGGIDKFLEWKDKSVDGGADAFDYECPKPAESVPGFEAGILCVSKTRYLPVNLPSDVDVKVEIGQGTASPVQFLIKRSTGCTVVRAPAGSGRFFLNQGTGVAAPFSKVFNSEIAALIAEADKKGEMLSAVHGITQMLDFGKRLAWNEAQVGDRWTFPTADLPWPGQPEADHLTSLYWLLGLMIPLGKQSNLASIQAIDRLDIHLLVGTKTVGSLCFPDLGTGGLNAYFRRVGDDFHRSFSAQLKGRAEITYVRPTYRGLQWDQAFGGTGSVWRIEVPGGVGNEKDPPGGEAAEIAPGFLLGRLGAVEARGQFVIGQAMPNLAPPTGPLKTAGTVAFVPGLAVTGTLALYRRFPNRRSVGAGDDVIATVLDFQPDADSAVALESLYRALDEDGVAFRRLLNEQATMQAATGWKLSLLHVGVLPWDGPRLGYRLLAKPDPARKSTAANESLVHPGGRLLLFVPAASALELSDVGGSPCRFLWRDKGARSVQMLEDRWGSVAGAWAKRHLNAIRIDGLAKPAEATVGLMVASDFSYAAAESVIRLEKILEVTGSNVTGGSDATDPRPDYEDDLVNLNSAKLLDSAGVEVEEHHLRVPQRMSPDGGFGATGRTQTIPLIHGWPRDPADVRPKPPQSVTWQEIRDLIGWHYGLVTRPPTGSPDREPIVAGPFQAWLEHTYGDRFLAVSKLDREARLEWPVDLASDVRLSQVDASGAAKPFLRCSYNYAANRLDLTFDVSALTPTYEGPTGQDGHLDGLNKNRAYAAGVAAWRSLAELASRDARARLRIDIGTYDLAKTLPTTDPARTIALRGLGAGWSEAVDRRIPVELPETALDAVREWARGLFAATTAPADPEPFGIPIPAGSGLKKIGDLAHVARAVLRIERPAAQAGPDQASQIRLPTSQQPGLFAVAANSLEEAWADLGFGPRDGRIEDADAGPAAGDLVRSHREWARRLREGEGSIPPDSAAAAAGRAAATPATATALTSALEGTDWFAPAGGGPLDDREWVAGTVMLPLGFSPCRPYGGLGEATHTALQRLAAGLRDAVDLSFESWARNDTDWVSRFNDIANLARPAATAGEWTGNLAVFAELVAGRLLWPEPLDEPDSKAVKLVDAEVTKLIKAMREAKGDLKWVRHAVRRRLLADPALLVDAKALLVNAIRFVEKSKTPSPSPSSLARVRYHRDIKGDRRLPSGKAEQAEIASSVLSLEDLILTGITGTESLDQRLGFLEVLDDARYDNSFRPKKPEKAPGTFEADSFEAVVDPAGAPAWPAADPVVPMAAENTSGLRRVQLASLSPVKAPILLWAGEPGAELVGGLPNGGSGDGRYSLENLLARSSAAPAAGHTALVAAVPSFRRGDPKPTADADLAWAFYMAEGDEEGSQTDGFYDSFLNDGFFIRLSREMKQRPAARALAAMRGSDVFQEKARSLEPPTPEELEKAEANLRELLVASRGSAAAARALDALILQPAGGQAFERVLGTIVRQSALQPPDPAKHALVRIGNGKPPTPHQPEPGTMALDINDVFVFRRETAVAGAPQPVFILFSFRAEVWSPVELEFTQGRNLDYRPWGVAAGSGESEPDHVFASEFWQAAPQSAAPSRHALAKDFSNAALIWTRQGRYIAGLDGTWRGQVEVEALLKRLLLDRNVTIDGLQTSGSILSGTAQAKFSPPVQISVFHEQFDDEVLGSRTGPVGRFLLSSRRFASPKEKHDFFPPEYDHFSLDFAWYSSSGLALLRLGRIFVQFD